MVVVVVRLTSEGRSGGEMIWCVLAVVRFDPLFFAVLWHGLTLTERALVG